MAEIDSIPSQNEHSILEAGAAAGNSLQFYSRGKLLITGEYLVLKGAKALAVPVHCGQSLYVEKTEGDKFLWNSSVGGKDWFNARFDSSSLEIDRTNNQKVARVLQQILKAAQKLNSDFLSQENGWLVSSNIEFNLDWGLGSSSSLISNIAYWAKCDPYLLNQFVFKGSGFDIACARSKTPVFYQLKSNLPVVQKADFAPLFANRLFLIWLNRKQDTREGVRHFNKKNDYTSEIDQINRITEELSNTSRFEVFADLLKEHEAVISGILKTRPVQEQLFPDFNGSVKSLGAWGGDFILAASTWPFEKVKSYFVQKGFSTIFKYNELVL